jgi:hypothetical protein
MSVWFLGMYVCSQWAVAVSVFVCVWVMTWQGVVPDVALQALLAVETALTMRTGKRIPDRVRILILTEFRGGWLPRVRLHRNFFLITAFHVTLSFLFLLLLFIFYIIFIHRDV